MAENIEQQPNPRKTHAVMLQQYLHVFEKAVFCPNASYQWIQLRIESLGGPTLDRKVLYDFAKQHAKKYLESRKRFCKNKNKRKPPSLTKERLVRR